MFRQMSVSPIISLAGGGRQIRRAQGDLPVCNALVEVQEQLQEEDLFFACLDDVHALSTPARTPEIGVLLVQKLRGDWQDTGPDRSLVKSGDLQG